MFHFRINFNVRYKYWGILQMSRHIFENNGGCISERETWIQQNKEDK